MKILTRLAISVMIVALIGDHFGWSKPITIGACVWIGFVVSYMSYIMSIPQREIS